MTYANKIIEMIKEAKKIEEVSPNWFHAIKQIPSAIRGLSVSNDDGSSSYPSAFPPKSTPAPQPAPQSPSGQGGISGAIDTMKNRLQQNRDAGNLQ